MFALAMRSFGILLLRRGHAHHAAYLAIAGEPGRQNAQHAFGIEPIGLGPSGASVYEDAGRLKHVGNDAMRCQQPMQPKPVATGLEAARHICGVPEFGRSSRSQFADERQQCRRVASLDTVQSRLLATWQPDRDEP